jgi:hypothetical protein
MQHLDNEHVIPVLYPAADAFAGTVYTDILSVQGLGAAFEVIKGVGTTGTSTITVQACDDVTPTNNTAVAFYYRESTTPDTWGDWTAATTTGFTTTAGSDQVYQVYVPSSELAAEGYGYVRLKLLEVANDPVYGCVMARVIGLRNGAQPDTLLT